MTALMDRSPFDLLFRRYRQELLVFAGQHANLEVAEDLVQEAYLRFMRQAETETIVNPRAYLYTLTRNLSADYLRQKQLRARYHVDDDALEEILVVAPEPEAELDACLSIERLRTALAELPENQRNVFLLHRFDGLTYNDISQQLGIPARTVERYANKAFVHCFNKVKAI